MIEAVLFYIFAGIAVCSSACVVLLKNPVTAAMMLVLDLCVLAAIYTLQGAEFAAAIQIIVYAGAIVILFTFVIMLLNLRQEEAGHTRLGPKVLTIAFVTIGFGVLLCKLVGTQALSSVPTALPAETDNTYEVGMTLFTRYLWPFELSSLLILLAVIASIVIARKPTLPAAGQDF